MRSVPIAIVGASGYSGEELLRLLLRHPLAEVVGVTSRQHTGKTIDAVFPGLTAWPAARRISFSDSNVDGIVRSGAEVVFLALPHGLAAEFAVPLLEAGLRVIDLSADFRVRDAAVVEEFTGVRHPAPGLLAEAVYGMPELHRAAIAGARLIASPGCYPTSIILPLAPLLRAGVISTGRIVANSMSGVSGAGRKPEISLLFAECNEDARAYGLPNHRHLMEVEQELGIAAGRSVRIAFHPHLIPINRGIQTTIHAGLETSFDKVGRALEDAYRGEPFIRLLGESRFPEIKHAVRTNFLDIAWHHDPRTRSVVLLAVEDNLVKGAGGQAVHAFNILAGFPETTGLT